MSRPFQVTRTISPMPASGEINPSVFAGTGDFVVDQITINSTSALQAYRSYYLDKKFTVEIIDNSEDFILALYSDQNIHGKIRVEALY